MTDKFISSLIEKIKLVKPDLSQKSINLYISELKILNDGKPFTNLKFLDDIEKIKGKLSHLKDFTQRNYYIAVCSVLSCLKKGKLYYEYYGHMMLLNQKIKSKNSGEKSEKEIKNWIDKDEITKIYNNLEEEALKLKDKDYINKDEYNTILSYIVMSFYVLLPPRRNEIYNIYLVQKKSKLDDKEKNIANENNIIDLDNDTIVYRSFKTKKSFGEQVFDLPRKLKDIIYLYMKFYKGEKKYKKSTPFCEPLFLSFYGKKFGSSNVITYILNDIFGKNISSTMLRHIYLTEKYGDKFDEMKKDSDMMAHSSEMQKEYIRDDK